MRKKNFTLLELLITIAIIAILSAMLLPMMGKAREKGKGISCSNNLKQLGIGLSNYWSGYGDWMPFGYDYLAKRPTLFHTLFPLIANVQVPETAILKYPVYICPSARYAHMYGNIVASYGHNRPANIWGYNGGITECAARKITVVRKPSQLFCMGDGRLDINEDRWSAGTLYQNTAPEYGDQEVVEKRHTDGVNLLYFDMHASSRQVLNIKVTDDPVLWLGQ